MNCRWIVVIALTAIAVSAPARAADERPPGPERGGRFRSAEAESLGYDAFRQLPGERQLDRREQARRWLRRARDRAHESAAAAEPASRQQFLRDAVDACATAVGLVPYLPDAWVAYARHLHAMGRYADTDACLDQFELTLRYERRENRRREMQQEALAIAARCAYNRGEPDRSRRAGEQALAIDEGDDATRLILVRALIQLERFDEARAAVDGFADRGPIYPRALAVLGVLEMRDGRYERAEWAFDRAWEYGMRGAVFDNDRGRLYLAMERYDEAVEQFEDAIESVPSFHEARNNLAVAHRRAGRLRESDLILQSVLEDQPDYAPAHFNRAELLRQRLDVAPDEDQRRRLAAEAMLHYTAALEYGYDPEVAMARRVEIADLAGDLERAEQDLLRMTEDPSVDARVLFLLGRIKKEQGRLDIATNLLRMAERRGYDTPRLHAELGEVLARQGDLEGARDELRRAVEADTEGSLVVTRVNLSVVLAQLGDSAAAEAVLTDAERLAPDHPLVIQQREALSGGGE